MATYRLAKFGIIRTIDGAAIPEDERNRDWREFAAWRDAGGIPDPETDPVAPARTASAKQIRYALAQMSKTADWETAVAASSASTRIYWQFEPDPPETNPKMKRIATAASVDIAALYDLAVTL